MIEMTSLAESAAELWARWQNVKAELRRVGTGLLIVGVSYLAVRVTAWAWVAMAAVR